jgi:hypothetical protein
VSIVISIVAILFSILAIIESRISQLREPDGLTPAESMLVKTHVAASKSGIGHDFCYELSGIPVIQNGWYCISYWGEKGK